MALEKQLLDQKMAAAVKQTGISKISSVGAEINIDWCIRPIVDIIVRVFDPSL